MLFVLPPSTKIIGLPAPAFVILRQFVSLPSVLLPMLSTLMYEAVEAKANMKSLMTFKSEKVKRVL